MTSITLTALLHAAVLSTGANNYADAHRQNAETGRPLVVLVGADWCPACRVMKDSTLPQVAQRGLLNQVAFAVVNTDRDDRIATSIMEPGVIPQLVMYRKTPEGWKRDSLVGSRSAGEIEAFLKRGLEAPAIVSASR